MGRTKILGSTGGPEVKHLTVKNPTGPLGGLVRHRNGDAVQEFDLTDFRSAERFRDLLKTWGLSTEPIRYEKSEHRKPFVWVNENVALITGANPLTGEMRDGGSKSIGYASYIIVTGHPEAVELLSDYIRSEAPYIKGEY